MQLRKHNNLKEMSDELQNWPILSADKITNKNLSRVIQKSPHFVGRQNRPILSAKIEHALSSTILSTDFLYIEQHILFMLLCWLFTTEDEYLFQLFIVFLIYFRSLDAEKSDASII